MARNERKDEPTMTQLLKEALLDCDSLYRVVKDTGVQLASLIRFRRGAQSLRLDKADVLARYFGVKVSRKQKGR